MTTIGRAKCIIWAVGANLKGIVPSQAWIGMIFDG